MHLIDIDSGVLGAVPIVGSTIPIGTGAAWAEKLNNSKNIDCKNLAINEISGKFISFYESFNDWESSATHSNFKNNKIVLVETTTIDKELSNINLSNFSIIIKLDIEGNEFNEIQGGFETILKYEPLITIELSKYNLNNKRLIENKSEYRKLINKLQFKMSNKMNI
jgi:FkbM family methyltransferase